MPYVGGEVERVAAKMFAARSLGPLYETLSDYRTIVRRMMWPTDAELMGVARMLEQVETLNAA